MAEPNIIKEPDLKTEVPENLDSTQPSEEETVGYYMAKSLMTIESGELMEKAYQLLTRYSISCLPVLRRGELIGMVTGSCIIRAFGGGKGLRSRVDEVMRPPLTIRVGQTIYTAIEKLRESHAHHLVVMDTEGHLSGLISQTDLLEASRRLLLKHRSNIRGLQQLAYTDPLTWLFTRRYFNIVFARELKRVRKFSGLLALIMMDLDHFKKINDTYGHVAGDMVLREFGKIIKKHVRKADVAARYGGEEMAILLPGCGTRVAALLADRIRHELEETEFSYEGKKFKLTVSAGVCKWAGSMERPRDMIAVADKALYSAKAQGRNRILVSS